MNKTTTKLAVSVLVTCGMVFSCKKDQSSQPACEISTSGISGSYKLVSLQYKKNPTASSEDYLSFMEDCEKDDLLVLKQDGTYSYNDIGNICSPNRSEEGTWEVKNNLLISDGVFHGTIKSYDCKTLIFYTNDTVEKGDQIIYTIVKQ